MRLPWWTNTQRHRQCIITLKAVIRHRLRTEDYTCKLPKLKPRVRYKLRTRWFKFPREANVWPRRQLVWR